MNTILDTLITRYPSLEPVRADIEKAYAILEETYLNGGKVLCCGNGGSASDAGHIVGELMKSFVFKRPIRKDTAEALSAYGEYGTHLSAKLEGALPAISLNTHEALSSAYINDTDSSSVYAQLLYGLGRAGDTLVVLTTSGNSRNCVLAAVAAKATGIKVVSLTGQSGGEIARYSDANIAVPEKETYKVQELHLPVYHALCAMLEKRFFS